ncbi:zinc ribbon domain-containing protein [Elusimicrobiota bacterium]
MKETLHLFTQLQAHDMDADKLRLRLDEIPVEIEKMNSLIEQNKATLEAKKQELNKSAIERKNLEMDLAKKEEEIRKHSGELQGVKSNEAYRVILSAIENLKIDKNKIEDSVLQLLEQSDQIKKDESMAQKEFQKEEQQLRAKHREIETEQKDLEAKLNEMMEKRKDLSKNIPENYIDRYERLRTKKEGVAIVPVLNRTSCGGCRMTLPPQVINEVLKSRTFIACENCQRILYMPQEEQEEGEKVDAGDKGDSLSS